MYVYTYISYIYIYIIYKYISYIIYIYHIYIYISCTPATNTQPAGLLRQWVLTKVNGLGKLFALLSSLTVRWSRDPPSRLQVDCSESYDTNISDISDYWCMPYHHIISKISKYNSYFGDNNYVSFLNSDSSDLTQPVALAPAVVGCAPVSTRFRTKAIRRASAHHMPDMLLRVVVSSNCSAHEERLSTVKLSIL